jgi:hypothetical protein
MSETAYRLVSPLALQRCRQSDIVGRVNQAKPFLSEQCLNANPCRFAHSIKEREPPRDRHNHAEKA